MKIKAIFGLILCLVLNYGIANETYSARFDAATQAYDSNNFVEAVNVYEMLLTEQIVSSDLHFNLGNAYFKQNQVPKAILNYEKALKIDPNNADAAYNLKLANEKTIDKIESIPELFLYRWWKTIFNLFSSETWASLAIAFIYLALILSAIYFFSSSVSLKKIGFYAATTLLALALFSWFLAHKQKAYLNSTDYAIIIEPTVNINSSPSAGSSKLFVLHEGTKVKVLNQTEAWLEVSIPNGNKGWIKESLLEGI
jgi:tetratricopeptide (TPR) repeat protein